MKTKGARLTTEISLPGPLRRLRPARRGPRRLAPARRRRAQPPEGHPQGDRRPQRAASSSAPPPRARPPRTSSATSSSCSGSGRRSRRGRSQAKAPALVYQEAELPLRVIRDLFTGDFERALVDHERTHKRIVGYLKKTSPHMVERVDPLQGEDAALRGASASTQEIRSTLSRRVDLPSGGYLIFDYAEAFTVIDVNTGRFVGSRSKTLGRAARGHDHEEQPRGGEGGRAPAAAARHRRDHRHRLHRHGEPEEPRDGRGGAADRARARPDEDLRRRDLAARPRRDDAPERHRRPARDPDAEVPDLRRRRDRRLRGVRRGRGRAPAAGARHARLARAGVPRRGERARGVAADRARRRRGSPRSRS